MLSESTYAALRARVDKAARHAAAHPWASQYVADVHLLLSEMEVHGRLSRVLKAARLDRTCQCATCRMIHELDVLPLAR